MLTNMILKSDGMNYFCRMKQKRPLFKKNVSVRSEKSKKFDKFYYEAQYKNIPENDILNYIQMRFWETSDDICKDTVTSDECLDLYEKFMARKYKQQKLFREKAYLLKPNFWCTFTYSDLKETAESFEKRLIIAFNNLSKRYGWKVMGGWEKGELGSRSHFHALIFVPKGMMVGELVARSRYSRKKRKIEVYTDNTYFSERFGISDWVAITPEELSNGRIINYLTKYISKSGRRLFYSRGIPNEIYIGVDSEKDIFMSYYNHGLRFLLFRDNFINLKKFKSKIENMFVFDNDFLGVNEDVTFIPMLN